MNQAYKDITDKLGPPLWWDEVGAPRYEPFRPGLVNCIYAEEAALLLIACQACRTAFEVAMTQSPVKAVATGRFVTLRQQIENRVIHYGDPPNFGCCASGPTMNCDDLQVLQFWRRNRFEWVRDSSLEVKLEEEMI